MTPKDKKSIEQSEKRRASLKTFLLLHVILMVYSLSDLFAKAAAGYELSDPLFYLFYCGVIGMLGLYALGWQQVIKKLPLITAFSNKAITVFWGLIWGVIFFQEEVTLTKVIGILIIILGVVLFARADANDAARHANEVTKERGL